MDWQEQSHSDAQVLLDKPVVEGTRPSVEFLLDLFAAGWTEEQVVENYAGWKPVGFQPPFGRLKLDLR